MSKFFTWTKGDRLHAAEVLRSSQAVPFPIDITIKGLDCARNDKASTKAGRKPPPLVFDAVPSAVSNESTRTSDSWALQDAALKSATSLMTVMNDVLRSPQLSAHLSAAHYAQCTDPSPTYGRPRARTAPPTPIFELPTTGPAELPGSTPEVDKVFSSRACFREDVKAAASVFADPVEQPRFESPQPAYYEPSHLRSTSAEKLHRQDAHQQPTPMSSPLRSCWSRDRDEETLVGSDSASKASSKSWPILSLCQPEPMDTLTPAPPVASSLPTNSPEIPRTGIKTIGDGTGHHDTKARPENDAVAMRHSHEAYVQSLKNAHERELATHKEYIRILENRQTTIETHHCHKQCDEVSLGSVHTGIAPVVASSPNPITEGMGHRRALRNVIASLEARLVSANNERIDVLEGFHEACEKLQHLSQRERILTQELEGLRQRRTPVISSLTTPLTPPDDELNVPNHFRHKRTISDIGMGSETAHPLLQQIRDLRRAGAEKDKRIRELEEVQRDRASVSQILRQQSTSPPSTHLPDLMQELDEQKSLLATARADIERYDSLLHAEIRRKSRSVAEAKLVSSPEVAVYASAVLAEKTARLKTPTAFSSTSTNGVSDASSSTVALLEKELHHCISEIVMHKLDLRMHKKDLKRAHARLKSLEEDNHQSSAPFGGISNNTQPRHNQSHQHNDIYVHPQPPPPPSSSSNAEETSLASASTMIIRSGLGVSVLQLPKKRQPSNSSSSTTTTSPPPPAFSPSPASFPASPPPRTIKILTSPSPKSPPTQPRTPLRVDKKLPPPPTSSSQGSASPSRASKAGTGERSEALRSLSDSLITSYAAGQSGGCELVRRTGRRTESKGVVGLETSPRARGLGVTALSLEQFAATHP